MSNPKQRPSFPSAQSSPQLRLPPPQFQFDNASDTELTPECPAAERSNPFDDLAPPSMVGARRIEIGMNGLGGSRIGSGREREESEESDDLMLGQSLSAGGNGLGRGIGYGSGYGSGIAPGTGKQYSPVKGGITSPHTKSPEKKQPIRQAPPPRPLQPEPQAHKGGWLSSLAAGIGLGLGGTGSQLDDKHESGNGNSLGESHRRRISSQVGLASRRSGSARMSPAQEQDQALLDALSTFSFPPNREVTPSPRNKQDQDHQNPLHKSVIQSMKKHHHQSLPLLPLGLQKPITGNSPMPQDGKIATDLFSPSLSLSQGKQNRPQPLPAQQHRSKGSLGSLGNRSQLSMRCNVPPIPLRATKDLGAQKRVESGQGFVPLPSPVYKTLRGEGNGYSDIEIDLTDPLEVDPFTVINQDEKKIQAQSKRPRTAPESPINTIKKKPVPALSELTPPRYTPLSPESPSRPEEKPQMMQPRIVIPPQQEQETYQSLGTLLDMPEEEPDQTAAQKALAEHELDPEFEARYEIKDLLGEGGFGFVVSAWSKYENKEVAVKFITKRSIPERSYTKYWRRRDSSVGITSGVALKKNDSEGTYVPTEAAILQFCKHPGIIGFEGLYEDSTYFYLVQELHGTPWSKSLQSSEDEPIVAPHSADPTVTSFFNQAQFGFGASDSATSLASMVSDSGTMSPSPSALLTPTTSVARGLNAPPPGLPRRGSSPGPASAFTPKRPPLQRRNSADLFEFVETQDHCDETTAKKIFSQVVDAVAYLHHNGIVHRDIKDENIVIDDNLNVKIIDFGSAVIYDPRQEPPYYDRFYGTMNFASAEILLGYSYQAAPAEIWSLGCLLAVILTGLTPFQNQRDACRGKIKLKHDVSRGALDLLSKLLHPDPHRRATIDHVRHHRWLADASAIQPFPTPVKTRSTSDRR